MSDRKAHPDPVEEIIISANDVRECINDLLEERDDALAEITRLKTACDREHARAERHKVAEKHDKAEIARLRDEMFRRSLCPGARRPTSQPGGCERFDGCQWFKRGRCAVDGWEPER